MFNCSTILIIKHAVHSVHADNIKSCILEKCIRKLLKNKANSEINVPLHKFLLNFFPLIFSCIK